MEEFPGNLKYSFIITETAGAVITVGGVVVRRPLRAEDNLGMASNFNSIIIIISTLLLLLSQQPQLMQL